MQPSVFKQATPAGKAGAPNSQQHVPSIAHPRGHRITPVSCASLLRAALICRCLHLWTVSSANGRSWQIRATRARSEGPTSPPGPQCNAKAPPSRGEPVGLVGLAWLGGRGLPDYRERSPSRSAAIAGTAAAAWRSPPAEEATMVRPRNLTGHERDDHPRAA